MIPWGYLSLVTTSGWWLVELCLFGTQRNGKRHDGGTKMNCFYGKEINLQVGVTGDLVGDFVGAFEGLGVTGLES